jgi:hypothetical protein
MKKLLLIIPLLLLFAVPCHATGITNGHAGIMVTFKDGRINHMETIDVAKFKDYLSLEVGYAGDTDETDHKAVLALSLDLKQLKLGNYVKLPILDLVEFRPAVIAYVGNINTRDFAGAKSGFGVGATFISTKF